MKKTIDLSVIVNAIDAVTNECAQYYNVVTGEVESVPSWNNHDVDMESFRDVMDKINASNDYVRLPGQQDLHEYSIMERFAEITGRSELWRALKGGRPFRAFKDEAINLGLIEQYYAFQHDAYVDIARKWCQDNDIPYTNLDADDGEPIIMNLYYTGKGDAAIRFVLDMERTGTADAVRAEPGNLRYDYFLSLNDQHTVLLIDGWKSQAALDAHHRSGMMKTIAQLREKYDLHMRAERYISQNSDDESFLRK